MRPTRATAGATPDAAMACACARDGLGRSEPCRELDVERVEDGLPRPLDRARCYQQIGSRKCASGRRGARVGQTEHGEHPCPYYTNVLSWRLSLERQTSVTRGRISGRRLVFL